METPASPEHQQTEFLRQMLRGVDEHLRNLKLRPTTRRMAKRNRRELDLLTRARRHILRSLRSISLGEARSAAEYGFLAGWDFASAQIDPRDERDGARKREARAKGGRATKSTVSDDEMLSIWERDEAKRPDDKPTPRSVRLEPKIGMTARWIRDAVKRARKKRESG